MTKTYNPSINDLKLDAARTAASRALVKMLHGEYVAAAVLYDKAANSLPPGRQEIAANYRASAETARRYAADATLADECG